jgi:hypothetical protein
VVPVAKSGRSVVPGVRDPPTPGSASGCHTFPHMHLTHPPHTPTQVVEPSEVEASYQALAGSLGEEMRSTLAFTAPATGQYAMTAAFFRAAAKHVQDDPSALYRLVPQADIAGRGAQVSGYRLQRQLADLLLPDTLAALGGANAGLLGVDCKEEFSQVGGAWRCVVGRLVHGWCLVVMRCTLIAVCSASASACSVTDCHRLVATFTRRCSGGSSLLPLCYLGLLPAPLTRCPLPLPPAGVWLSTMAPS